MRSVPALEDPIIKSIALANDCTAAQVCMSWILSKGFALVTKTQNQGRMKENLESQKIKISKEDVEKIDKLTEFNQRLFFDNYEVL